MGHQPDGLPRKLLRPILRPGVQLTGFFKIADGVIDAVPVDIRTLFTSALLSGANKIVLAHNHPSGTLRPSPADMNLTNKAVNAGELLDIEILDHIIITENSYYSFKDEGLL
ncbi:JAB domain-containing protein [Parapedobacter sp. 10938]|uniref:JAB domain-containing protein n=1 Tax=Parapedobacter flavus TaxID=3110225 RepID=UPI002DB60E43|nr:JAB domain-containing protein [Parapedobacter sp. 10938]MEC3881993.1 JAB domain-containing protein [Parapedobacter sp. 10938]